VQLSRRMTAERTLRIMADFRTIRFVLKSTHARAGDQQNILHPKGHQVLEDLKEALGVDDGVGGVGYGHLLSYLKCHPERSGRSQSERPRSRRTPWF
jgi:hypothetical protein